MSSTLFATTEIHHSWTDKDKGEDKRLVFKRGEPIKGVPADVAEGWLAIGSASLVNPDASAQVAVQTDEIDAANARIVDLEAELAACVEEVEELQRIVEEYKTQAEKPPVK